MKRRGEGGQGRKSRGMRMRGSRGGGYVRRWIERFRGGGRVEEGIRFILS